MERLTVSGTHAEIGFSIVTDSKNVKISLKRGFEKFLPEAISKLGFLLDVKARAQRRVLAKRLS